MFPIRDENGGGRMGTKIALLTRTERIFLATSTVLLIALLLSWVAPIHDDIAFQPRVYPGAMYVWAPERGIEFLEWARDSHQQLIDYPEQQNESTGDTEWNRKLVSEYQQMINLLEGND